jgi:integrase
MFLGAVATLSRSAAPLVMRTMPQGVSARKQRSLSSACHPGSEQKSTVLWASTLRAYAAPIWNKPVAEIETGDVLAILRPIWHGKNETASRVRGRIERVLDAAAAHGRRSGDNPARWRGHLSLLLSSRPKRVNHHAALPYPEVPGFMADLRQRDGMAALALSFVIFTAARTSEVLGARWDEIDRAGKVWIVPAARMKSERVHRVPLTESALTILDRAEQPRRELRPDGFVFEGDRRGKRRQTAPQRRQWSFAIAWMPHL